LLILVCEPPFGRLPYSRPDIAEPELPSVTFSIMRDTNEPARDRLRAEAAESP
jgi:hypothetical protein